MRYQPASKSIEICRGRDVQRWPLGLDFTGDGDGPWILAFSSEWIRQEVVDFNGPKGCRVFRGGDTPVADAQAHLLEIGRLKQGGPRLQSVEGDLFVAAWEPRCSFKVLVHGDRDLVRSQDLGQKTITLEMQRLDLGKDAQILTFEGDTAYKINANIWDLAPRYHGEVALDIGTTNTAGAYIGRDGVLRQFSYIEAEDAESTIPTVVHYRSLGRQRQYMIGVEATNEQQQEDPRSFVLGMKRFLGLPAEDRVFTVTTTDGQHDRLSVDDVYQDFLQRYVDRFSIRLRAHIKKAKAVYPPGSRKRALEKMRSAYSSLGIETEALHGIDEASAAALFYVWRRLLDSGSDALQYVEFYGDEHNVLIYDLGGGTTDIALVKVVVEDVVVEGKREPSVKISVLAKTSVMDIGGDNFTLELLKSLKCRIAVATAFHHQGAGNLGEDLGTEAAKALDEMYADREMIQNELESLETRDLQRAEREKIWDHLYKLADKVIPTAWVKLEKEELEDPFAPMRAFQNFFILWRIAEEFKKTLTLKDEVQLTPAWFQGTGRHYERFQRLRLDEEAFRMIRLQRKVDLEDRIEGLLEETIERARGVRTEPAGDRWDVHSVQLVGNSCNLPCVRERWKKECTEWMVAPDMLRFDRKNAKSSVAQGACIGRKIEAMGQLAGIRVKFEDPERGVDFQVGYEDAMGRFQMLFPAGTVPGEQVYEDIPDGDFETLTIKRLYPGRGGKVEEFGYFVMDKPATRSIACDSPPTGKLRIVLRTRYQVWMAGRGRWFVLGRHPFGLRVRRNPFSGVH